MTRRESVRRAALLTFGLVLGKFDALKAANSGQNMSKAQLSVDLGQWKEIIFSLHGKTVAVSVSEIYAALSDTTKLKGQV